MEEQPNNHAPLLYNRVIVFVFTLFLGAFFGSILFCQNLKATGKGKFIARTIIAALLCNLIIIRLLRYVDLHTPFLQLWVGNLLPAFILTGPYWNYHFNEIEDYNERSVVWPLLIIILIYAFFIYMNVIRGGGSR